MSALAAILARMRPARDANWGLPFPGQALFFRDLWPEHCQQRGDDQASENYRRRDGVPAAVVRVAHQAAPQPSGGRLELHRERVQPGPVEDRAVSRVTGSPTRSCGRRDDGARQRILI